MKTAGRYDLVIVGAGPVGSAAAVIASRHGLKTLLVDQSLDVFPLPRAIHFDADIMRILQFAGLAELVEPITRATTGGVHLGMDGEPIRQFRVPDHPGDLGWRPHYMFFQPQFDALLRSAAATSPGVEVRLGVACEDVNQSDEDEVLVTLRDSDGTTSTVHAEFVIAADGASSEIRKRLDLGLSDYGFEEPWVIIDGLVDDPTLGPDYTIMYCDPARPGTYVPGPGRHRRWEFMLLPGETGESLETADGLRSLVGPVTPWLDLDTFEVQRVAVYQFHALVAEQWRSGRVFLAGDAAHQTPPFYGQGMCHGLRDARNLLWKIAAIRNGAPAEPLLDSYQAEREPHVRAIIEAAVENGRYICTLDAEVAAQRDQTLRARMSQGADVRSFRAVIPGLTTGLLDPDPQSDGVGLLFVQPHVRTKRGDSLLDALLGDGWALVSQPGIVGIEDARSLRELDVRPFEIGADCDDPSGIVNEWFAAFGCSAAILRPDRYVFGTATADDVGALLARFAQTVPRATSIPQFEDVR
jgi:3-(3-hydroxy-phenyl)propionate hydroxylase